MNTDLTSSGPEADAGSGGGEDAFVTEFLSNPCAFEFFQAIKILSRKLNLPNLNPADGDAVRRARFDSSYEPAAVGGHTGFSFPAGDIQSVTEVLDGKPEMRLNMMGLTGVSGPLPHYYTSLIIEAKADRDTALEDFLNIFNHRLAYLFYYAWEKSRFPAAFERTGHDPLRRMLLALVGVPSELPMPGGLPEEFFIRFAPLLAMQPRSGESLRTILAAYFEVDFEIEQYAGCWQRLNSTSLTRVGSGDDSIAGRLGQGTVAGSEYWSMDSMVRIRIGPLRREAFDRFLPGAEWNAALREICRFFSRDEMDFEIRLILDRRDVPGCLVCACSGLRLGSTTWLLSRTPDTDKQDTMFRLK